jgi:hypothetical protein
MLENGHVASPPSMITDEDKKKVVVSTTVISNPFIGEQARYLIVIYCALFVLFNIVCYAFLCQCIDMYTM